MKDDRELTSEERQSIGAIVAELKSQDKDVRLAAIKKLEQMGNPAVQYLLEQLEDSQNTALCHLACIALAKMSDPTHAADARAKLGAYVEGHNEYYALDAIKAMVKIGDEYVVDYLMLVTLKTHPIERVRASAAMALGNIGDTRAIPALTQALQDQSWQNVRPAAEWALKKLS